MNSDLKTTHGRLAGGLPLPQIEGIEHRFVELQGIRLHIAEAGQGESLLLLHGWPQHWYMWRHLIPQLAAHYRVLCPDLRGFGWSAAPKSGYEKEQLATDISALLETLGLERVRLISYPFSSFQAARILWPFMCSCSCFCPSSCSTCLSQPPVSVLRDHRRSRSCLSWG